MADTHIHIAGLGFTGGAIAERLIARGWTVSGCNRSGSSAVAGMDVRAVDVLRPESLTNLKDLPPVDFMVCALSGTGHRDSAAYRSVYVEGPSRIADALRWRGARRMVFLGSTGVYGGAEGDWVTEETEPEPSHRAGEVQLAAEAALRDAAEEVSVLRLSGLYGPGRTRLIRQALRRRPFLKPDLWSNQIHRDDVAGAVEFLLTRGDPLPGLLLLSDDRPALRREIFTWVREQCGCPEGCIDEDHPDRATRDRGNKRVSNRLLRSLGVPLMYSDYRLGLAAYLPQNTGAPISASASGE